MFPLLAALALISPPTTAAPVSTRTERAGWIYVRLEGTPSQIGRQHGTLLAPEIDDAIRMDQFYLKSTTGHLWPFYREAAQRLFWKKLDPEYRDEIAGIAEGLQSKGFKYDSTDVLAYNAFIELSGYYVPVYEAKHRHAALESKAPPNCSAFIATGDQTKDHRIVMAHNNWIDYIIGERWRAILDIRPTHGHRILMDALPGFIHSGDDFAINSAGLMLTETTIAGAVGFDENGLPEFERMRKAIQYGDNLDDFARIMTKGNNGGYANTWLVGDTKTDEIGELELGLKNVIFKRAKNGAFVGANFPQDPKLIAEDCAENVNKGSNACSDRHVRWNTLMKEYRGKIDVETAKQFLGDHVDEVSGKQAASGGTLCAHGEDETRPGFVVGLPAHYPIGAVQGKATTSALVEKMTIWARLGHPCGTEFLAKPFLAAHKEHAWTAPFLHDMKRQEWTQFSAK